LEPTDESLLRDFVRGRRDPLGELARRYERPLLGLARGLLGGREDLARDAVQDTWLRVIRYGRSFNGTSSVKTWLYRIAINRCRDLRARPLPALNGTVEGHAPAAQTDADALTHHLNTLAPDRRELLLLCYHDGITHQHAAAILELPLGTLKSRLHAALADLRKAMAAEAHA
jgi:RNA polymerase sigma-70 factor, ECF subfamily